MKIENYEGTADAFTFPHNPNVFDDELVPNNTNTLIPYASQHIFVSGGGVNPKKIVLTGHFDGANKNTNYQDLSKHVFETKKLKKLYFGTDRFYLGFGKQIKQVNTGGRTNLIDYIMSFETITGIILGNTQRNSGTNEGNVTTYIEEITGTITDGAVDVTVTDGTNSFTLDSSTFATGNDFVYKFVAMVSSGGGIYITEYRYITIEASQVKGIKTTGGDGIPKLAPGANVSTITTTNLTTSVENFRDGWSS